MIAVVIPSYKCSKYILNVISQIGPEVKHIYIIDDCCPEETGNFVKKNCTDSRVHIVFHKINQGVGGAVITGYKEAIKDGCEIVIKVDGDGQMDPTLIPLFISPIINGEADYTKGNRFNQIENLEQMPPIRIFGNAVLSFLSKLSTGYWGIFDPTNGYTAIHTSILSQINLEKISRRYFFETDMLFRLNISNAVVVDIPMQAKYGDEISNLSEFKIIPTFLKGHFKNFNKRIFYNYFLRDFHIASLELLLGIPLLLFGLLFGSYQWYIHYKINEPTPTGTIVLASLTITLGIQFILSFFSFDFSSQPKNPLQKVFKNNIKK